MEKKKYFIVLLLTCVVFAAAWLASSYFNRQKFASLQSTQEKVATDILSSETQFDLLEESSCDAAGRSLFSKEIAALADKISYSEEHVATPAEILELKKQYTILEVKDFILSKRIGERCKKLPVSILYFYGTKAECPDCVRQGYVLDALSVKYPQIRTYSFDADLNLSTVHALTSIYAIDQKLPAIVIDGKTTLGFKTLEEIEALLPGRLFE